MNKHIEAMEGLKMFLHNINNLPSIARFEPVSHSDLAAVLEMLIYVIEGDGDGVQEETLRKDD